MERPLLYKRIFYEGRQFFMLCSFLNILSKIIYKMLNPRHDVSIGTIRVDQRHFGRRAKDNAKTFRLPMAQKTVISI
jgi:hypothetical protein